MKKLLLIAPIILLTACTTQDPDTFAKKENCLQYLNNVELLAQGHGNTKPIIFYSPKVDSCLGAISFTQIINEQFTVNYLIQDMLTNEQIYLDQATEDWEAKVSVYEQKIVELKGE